MQYILLIIVFALVHALLLRHIVLFGMVVPLLYVYLVLLFPRNYPRWATLLLSFAMGMAVDMFNNTPGLASASMTLTGFLQPYLLELYMRKEDDNNFRPSLAGMGFVKFASYAMFLLTAYCLVFFTLEAFTFSLWQTWLISVFGSMLLTLVIILTIDSIRRR